MGNSNQGGEQAEVVVMEDSPNGGANENNASTNAQVDEIVLDVSPERPPGLLRQLTAGTPSLSNVLQAVTPTFGTPADTFKCNVCLEFYPYNPKEHVELACGHKFCRECLDGWWTCRIIDADMDLKCFHTEMDGGEECGFPVSYDEVKEVVTHEVYQKWERFRRMHNDAQLRDCPYPGCGHDQTGDPSRPIMNCGKCGKEYCFVHSNSHVGETCGKYEKKMKREFRMNRQAAGKRAKDCPGCGFLIAKNGGCNHMTCAKCGEEFCWLCHEVIKGNVGGHYNSGGCVQFSTPVFPFVREDAPWWYWFLKLFIMTYFAVFFVPPVLFCMLLGSPVLLYMRLDRFNSLRETFPEWMEECVVYIMGFFGALIFGPIACAFGCAAGFVGCICLPCLCASEGEPEEAVRIYVTEVVPALFAGLGMFVAGCTFLAVFGGPIFIFSLILSLCFCCNFDRGQAFMQDNDAMFD